MNRVYHYYMYILSLNAYTVCATDSAHFLYTAGTVICFEPHCLSCLHHSWSKPLAPVVQRLDNAIHRINHYPADSVVCFVNTYPLDSDLSGG